MPAASPWASLIAVHVNPRNLLRRPCRRLCRRRRLVEDRISCRHQRHFSEKQMSPDGAAEDLPPPSSAISIILPCRCRHPGKRYPPSSKIRPENEQEQKFDDSEHAERR